MMMIAPGVFLTAFLLFLRSTAPGLELEDSGELILAAWSLGVSGSPGAPWHALVGRLMFMLPAGSPAFRVTLVSVVAGALAAVAVYRIAFRLAGNGRGAVSAGVIAALALIFARPFWWQAGLAATPVPAAALAALALLAASTGTASGVRLAALVAGLAWGVEIAGIAVVAGVLLAVWRSRGRLPARHIALAALCFVMPLGGHAMYLGIRAAAAPEVNRGWTDRAPALARHLAARPAMRTWLLRDPSARGVAGEAVRHAVSLPWIGFGPLLALAAVGAWAVRQRDPAMFAPSAMVWCATVLLGALLHRSEGERWAAMACVPVSVFIGAGAAWVGSLRSWVPIICAAVACWQGASAHAMARRDRSMHALDHARNLLMVVGPADHVWAGGDLTGRVLQYSRVIDRDVRAAGAATSDALVWGSRDRNSISPTPARGDSGPALIWAQAALAGRSALFMTSDQPPGVLPSRGFRWRGMLVRVTHSGNVPGRDEGDARWLRGLRLASFFRARGSYPSALAQGYALALHARARLAASPVAMEAESRVALWLNGAQPEPRLTLGRALLALGREPDAVEEWHRALSLTRGAYMDPYLELAGVASARAASRAGGSRDEAAEESLEFLRTAAALGAGADSADVAAGDAARAGGRKADAAVHYRRGVAAGLDHRGLRHFAEGRYPQAAAAWESAVAQDPGASGPRHHLGTLAAVEERFADARSWYRSAMRLPGASSDLADLDARAAESLAWAPKVAALESRSWAAPRDVGRLCDLGNAYFYLGRTAPAEALYRRALAIEPGSVRALANLGSALVQLGRVDEAIAAYVRVFEIDPKHADACVNLVAVYLGLGQRDRAKIWLARALALRPDHPRARQLAPEVGP